MNAESSRILLLEDNPSDALLLRRALRAAGYERFHVQEAARLAHALECLSAEAFDLAVCDLNLPDSRGLDTFLAVHASAPRLPIVVVTGMDEADLGVLAIRAGAQEYLVKGELGDRALGRAIGHALERGRLERALEEANQNLEARVRERTAELRESEARFRSLTELSSDWYWEQDEQLRFVDFSPSVVERAGSSIASHIGKTRWELPTIGVSEQQWAAHRATLEARLPFRNFEFRRVSERGETIWVSVSGTPIFDAQGRFAGYRGIGRNITERKTAEEAMRASGRRFRQIVETASEGIWQIDAESRTTYVNRRMAEILGYTVAEMDGASLFQFMDEEGKGIAAENVERRRRGIKEQHDFKFRRKDGGELWAIVSADPIFDSEGRYAGALGLITDITERKQAEGRLREGAMRLEELSRRLLRVQEEERRAIGRELHDRVGQNLSALGAHLEVVRGTLPARSRARVQPHLAKARELIEHSAAHMRELMAELRPPGLEEYGLLAALRVYAGTLAPLGGPKVELQGKDLSPRLPRETETALFRIAQEALANAARHARVRRVDVRVAQSDEAVTLSIADDGVGFDAARAGARPNWGLDVMRERADAVGARLRVASEPGRGARVSVEVPWRAA